MNNINNLLNGSEYIFTIPFNNSIDIFETIENMLEELNSNSNILNITNNQIDGDYVQFDIEFEINQEEDTPSDYFKTCSDINNRLCKSEKIKKNDHILNETCFICMDNYKESELKRTLPNCKHYFHKKCIDKWLKKKASCPICRDELLK